MGCGICTETLAAFLAGIITLANFILILMAQLFQAIFLARKKVKL